MRRRYSSKINRMAKKRSFAWNRTTWQDCLPLTQTDWPNKEKKSRPLKMKTQKPESKPLKNPRPRLFAPHSTLGCLHHNLIQPCHLDYYLNQGFSTCGSRPPWGREKFSEGTRRVRLYEPAFLVFSHCFRFYGKETVWLIFLAIQLAMEFCQMHLHFLGLLFYHKRAGLMLVLQSHMLFLKMMLFQHNMYNFLCAV